MDQIMIEKQKSYKSDFSETEKGDVDIWELRVEERDHILKQIAKDARKNRIRNWFELIFMIGFIYYMLYDTYKAGDFDTIIKFLKP
jgi:t-SNARE complex subunit (syntaxin)